MIGIQLNTAAIKTSVRVIKNLITVQSRARSRLVRDLANVCSKCDGAYASLLLRLKPVRSTFRSPNKLALELHALAADASARKKFKPDQLCTEIDALLMDLANNLNALKYSVNVFSIDQIRRAIQSMGNYDQALYNQYDEFMREMNSVAGAIETAQPDEKAALVAHARAAINDLEAELKSALTEIRKAKDEIVSIA